MAVGYPIPEWLQPRGNPGAEYVAAYRAGAEIAQEQQRLGVERERSAMASAERAQIAQQESLERQQRIEIDKQYTQQQIGLRKQALDQAQQKVDLAAQSAARKFAGQQKIRQAIDSGMSPDEAYLRFGGEAFGSMAGVGALSKEYHQRVNPTPPKDIVPKIFTDPSGRQIVYNPATGAAVKGQAEDKGPTVSVPLTDNPFGPKISGRLSDPNIRKALGTNAPAISGAQGQAKRVKVKSPDGKIGTLPADQVDEAIKAGYSLVK
jgi:hypothetical protein